MRRAVLVAAPLLVLLGVGLFVVVSDPGVLGGLMSGPSEPRGGNESDAAADHEDVPAGVTTASFSPVAPPGSRPAPDEKLLRVVERSSGRRIGGAEVSFLDPTTIDRTSIEEAMLIGGRTPMTLVGAFGRRFEADQDGELRLPAFRDRALLWGRHGTLVGFLEILPASDDPIVLELEEASALLLEVVDQGGRPRPDVPLALRVLEGGFPVDVWRGRSDGEHGLAVIPDVRKLADRVRGHGVAPLIATFGFPLANPVEVRVDPSTPPRAPVRLVLPPTGRVVVQLRDVGGGPVRHGAFVALHAVQDPVEDRGRLFGALVNHPARVEDGRAVFPYVGLGLLLELEAWMGDRVRPVEGRVQGPTAETPEVECRLEFQERYPAIVGRACDEGGVPLRSCTLRSALWTTAGTTRTFTGTSLRTDEEGRFRVVLKTEATARDHRELELALAQPATGRVLLVGHADLPAALVPADTDIGTVVLRTAPLIAAGEVVDADGLPVRGAVVTVEVREPGGRDGGEGWSADLDLCAESDASGRFAVCGRAQGRELRITASHPRHLPAEPLAAVAGAQGLKLVVLRGGSLEGSVLLDPEVRPSDLDVVLSPMRQPQPGAGEIVVRPEADGRFWFRVCPPGLARVSVCLRDERLPLAAVDDVDVRSAEATRDARLKALDLRGRLRAATVTVVDEADRPIPEARLLLSRPGRGAASGPWQRGAGDGTRIVFVMPAADMLVDADGFRPVRVANVSGDVRVVLRRGIPIRILLAGGAVVPAPPETLEAAFTLLAPVQIPPGNGLPGSQPLDRSGQLRQLLPGPGRYRVSWSVGRRGGWPDSGVGLPADCASMIDVVDAAAEQTFPVALSPAAIAEALKLLEP